jgi:predicted dehydrogenase
MDYMDAPPAFKVRKVARYARLYGPRRTMAKVRGQYHMRRRRPPFGGLRPPARADAHVGLIGCGKFAYTTIAYYLSREVGSVMRGAMDLHRVRATSLARRYRLHYATDDPRDVIEDPCVDLIYIASNHASHAEYAIEALRTGKNVHIEKPHVVSEDQLVRLCQTMSTSPGVVRLGFNRPDSKLGHQVRTLLDTQEGPTMFNWFVAGHEIPPDHWYFRPEEGGRVLGNLCHWTDFVLQMVPPERRFPIEIRPARAEQSDSNVAVSFVFGDGSIAAITFSAKGHAFEGVREHLSLHRGDLLLTLTDFQELRAHIRERRYRRRLHFRDHGQADSILRSYGMSTRGGKRTAGQAVEYVWETGQLFLKTREALEQDRKMSVEGFAPERLQGNYADAAIGGS